MKIIWKGSIAFGLVNIPIELYSATESHALGFTLLHEKCKTPLQYHRWCPHCKKEVPWHQTVKGLEKSDGSYMILTQEALKKLQPIKTEQIEVLEFVDQDEIDIIYLNNHYYVAPAKKGTNNAYALFIKALEKLNKVAIARFVMRDKEYICAIQPYKNYLLLTTFHYGYEIRALDKLAFTKVVTVKPAELKLAQEFIKKLSVTKLDLSKFTNRFAQEIKALLKNKTKKVGPRDIAKVVKKKSSLMDSLKANIAGVRRHPAIRQPAAQAKKRR